MNRNWPAHLGGWDGPNLTVSAVAMMSGLRSTAAFESSCKCFGRCYL